MEETLLPLMVLLTFIICITSLIGVVLICKESKKENKMDRARVIIMLTFAFEFIMCSMKIIQVIIWPKDSLEYKILDLPNTSIIFIFLTLLMVYPLEILRPGRLTPLKFLAWTSPYLLIIIIYLAGNFPVVELDDTIDVFKNLKEPDVYLRLICLGLTLPYSLALPIFNMSVKVNVTVIGLFVYSMTILFMNLLVVFYMLSANPYFYLIYTLVCIFSNIYLIFYEVKVRGKFESLGPTVNSNSAVFPTKEPEEKLAHATYPDKPQEPGKDILQNEMLFRKIYYQMEVKNAWRDPDLDIEKLAKEIGSNKTYVQKCIKVRTGTNFSEYMHRLRIANVQKELREHPQKDLKTVFSESGYNSRTTAWRNYKSIVGMTPTAYLERLKEDDKL